jgi:hypothetical protein
MKSVSKDLLIKKVVELGTEIRKQRQEGNLQSIVPPTIYGYRAFVRVAEALPHLDLRQVAMVTLLGNAGLEDRKVALGLVNRVFGLRESHNPESLREANLF